VLLERVRAELGEDARIVAANRVRRGGVGGFFSREHYEVIVDRVHEQLGIPLVVDLRDDELAPEFGSDCTGATSVLELAEAVNGTERVRQTRKAKRKPSERSSLNVRKVEGELIRDLVPSELPLDLTGDTLLVSTETERFVQILDRIARDVDDGRTADTDRPRRRPVEARAPREGQEIEITEERESADEAPKLGTQKLEAPKLEAQQVGGFAPSATPNMAPRVRRSRDVEIIERPENLLARMGLPPRFVPRGVNGAQLRPALIESLAHLPVAEALPEANGVVIAVIGVGAQPVILARMLATERGLDPDHIVLATERELGDGIPDWLKVTDPATAEERRRSWYRRGHPTLVAVSVPSVTNGAEWARLILDHLEPTQTWGIVDAVWKLEDSQAWADRLGGFDVLALEHLADTVSPAAPIQLETPIARLDGLPATPVRWAEILTGRLGQR
jgi:hypothetical protein